MSDVHIVILAAGKGTRMKSAQPKVLHRVAGLPMIDYVLTTAASISPQSQTVVVGHQAEMVKAVLGRHERLTFVVQEPQLGTAHALLTTEPALRNARGTLVMLSGDVPLLTAGTLKTLLARHQATRAAATVITALVRDPRGYGRVIRSARSGCADPSGQQIARIVEEKDATPAERQISEINSGIYAFALEGLFDAVRSIAAQNAQNEYYLPDLVAVFRQRELGVETVTVSNPDEVLGINSRHEMAEVSGIVRQQKTAELMAEGVTIEDPATAYIDRDVVIGRDTVIHPGVSIEGRTTIGSGCEIHSGARIVDSTIGNGVTVHNHCVITGARVADAASVGPFAHLRKDADVRERARVGNFVELKKTVLGAGSKSMHLAYLGDATIGEKVNIGAGTITCNYDGVNKNPTIIEDGAFIGSDTQLIAPVTVGKGAYVGSGATIRADVPAGALAVSAGKQRNIEGWVDKKNAQKAKG
jgi:bifunctional UDP-N-acetylglucosamine pyrophosphorylase/glucosamine-1-phosphate N-acetyltransferase